VLLPQHHNVPVARTPQVCANPVATLAQSLAVPTCTGTFAMYGLVEP
jgi:hypothetical protein